LLHSETVHRNEGGSERGDVLIPGIVEREDRESGEDEIDLRGVSEDPPIEARPAVRKPRRRRSMGRNRRLICASGDRGGEHGEKSAA
jgi:hypothetical protein